VRQPIAVDVRGLRNACPANQEHAKEYGEAQPERLRPGATSALGRSRHCVVVGRELSLDGRRPWNIYCEPARVCWVRVVPGLTVAARE
jgi:hypothetical protein